MLRTVAISAAVMIIVGTSSIFAWLVALQTVPEMIAGWFDAAGGSQVLCLLMVNLLMLFVGICFEEISALLILMLMPMLMPVAIELGIDPLHFGLIMSINLSIGLVAPPYNICMFLACAAADRRRRTGDLDSVNPARGGADALYLCATGGALAAPSLAMTDGLAVMGNRR